MHRLHVGLREALASAVERIDEGALADQPGVRGLVRAGGAQYPLWLKIESGSGACPPKPGVIYSVT